MSTEGWSLRILQQCALSQAQTLRVMEPFAYQMPHTEEQFNQLTDRLRRVGHQAENRAGTVLRLINNHGHAQHDGYHYHAVQEEDDPEMQIEAPPALTMQPGLKGPAQSSSSTSWPSASPDWGMGTEAHMQVSPMQSETPMFWGSTNTGGTRQQYLADSIYPDMDASSSATSSDDGCEPLDAPDYGHLDDATAAEQIFLMYRRRKRIWRRYTG